MIRKLAVTAALTGGLVMAATGMALANPAPVVTAVTPAADTTGSQVVVSGSNLTLPPKLKPDAVFFGKAQAIVSSCAPKGSAASSCNVTVPPQCPGTPKRVDVRVVVNGLESAVSPGDGFTYTDDQGGSASPCPSPTSGSPGPSTSPSPSSTATSTSTPSASPSAPVPSGAPGTGAGGASRSTAVLAGVSAAIIAVVLIGTASAVAAIRRRRT